MILNRFFIGGVLARKQAMEYKGFIVNSMFMYGKPEEKKYLYIQPQTIYIESSEDTEREMRVKSNTEWEIE